MQAKLGKRLTVTFIKSLSSSRVTLCRKDWEYIHKSPFSAKICSDISLELSLEVCALKDVQCHIGVIDDK